MGLKCASLRAAPILENLLEHLLLEPADDLNIFDQIHDRRVAFKIW